jgi:hypothetical protein
MIRVSDGRQPTTARSTYATLLFLERVEREHVAAMTGWTHPLNLAWAAKRATAQTATQRYSGRVAR